MLKRSLLLAALLACAPLTAVAGNTSAFLTTLSPQAKVKLVDNGDGTYSLGVANISPGGVFGNPSSVNPSFQQTATAAATPLTAQAGYVNGIVIKALTTNTGTVCVGDSTVNLTTACYPLKAGEAITYGVTTTAAVYIIDSTITDAVAVSGN